MTHDNTALLAHLRALEVALHQPAVRGDAARLDALLHADFREFGRSGTAYDKAAIMALLRAEPAATNVRADGFQLQRLAEDVALLTYRSSDQWPDGRRDRHTLRASIWRRGQDGWQMSFHQGTPAAAECPPRP